MRRFLIFTHRWMGIVGGLLFIAWFISGVVFMYRTMPAFSNADRLRHLVPLDLSTARVEPMDASRKAGIEPSRLRVAMYCRPFVASEATPVALWGVSRSFMATAADL
jgi:hypothetical protein